MPYLLIIYSGCQCEKVAESVDSQPAKKRIRRRRIIRPVNVAGQIRRLKKPLTSPSSKLDNSDEPSLVVISLGDDTPTIRGVPPFKV